MTKFLTVFTALFLFTAMPAMAATEKVVQHDVTISVSGMVCDFCAQSIKKVFGKQDSVETVDVNLDDGEILVDLKDGQKLDHDTITKLVTDAGYTVNKITDGAAE